MPRLFLLLLLLTLNFGSRAQTTNYYFNHLRVEDGLSQNTVWCILQDSHGFMWFGTKDGLNRYDGYQFRQFRHTINSTKGLCNNFIRSLFEASDGKIWIGTSQGVDIYDPANEQFTHLEAATPDGTRITGEINDIKADKQGNIWIAVNWQGLFRYNTSNGILTLFQHDPTDQGGLSSPNVWSLTLDSDGILWAGAHSGGLNKFDPKSQKFTHIEINGTDDIYKVVSNGNDILVGTGKSGLWIVDKDSHSVQQLLSGLFVRDIMPLDKEHLWIATESGVVIYNTISKQTNTIQKSITDRYSISSNAVYCIYRDRDQALWIGTYFGGVNYLSTNNGIFDKFYPTSSNGFSGSAVREFAKADDGKLWIGTEDAGLYRFNPQDNSFESYPQISYHNIHGICTDGDKLWVGTFTAGLNILDTKTGAVKIFKSSISDTNSISDNNIFSIYRTRSGDIWVGTIHGLNLYDRQNGHFKRISEVGANAFIHDIIEDNNGVMWFATYNTGVFSYNPRKKSWKQYRNNPLDSNSLCYDRVLTIFQDIDDNLWFGTEGGGVSRYNSASDQFTNFNSTNGLPNNVIYKILEDDNHNLWLSSNLGLAMLNTKQNQFITYTTTNGLLNDQFNYKSGIKTDDGRLYFGSIVGFVSFDPRKFTLSENIPPVVLTNMQLFNQDIEVGVEGSVLQNSLLYTNRIVLNHTQTTMSFDFAALSYNASNKNRYSYRMNGYQDQWTELPTNQRITYANIPPGQYMLEIRGSNSDGIWNEVGARLEIEIRPPIWLTTYAYLLYGLIICLAIWLTIRHFINRIKIRNHQHLAAMSHAKEQALYRAKIDFFTNIAHEIRTPLTLIKAPFEQIVRQKLSEDEYTENTKIIQSNINRLLNLVNQLLDFRKMENDRYTLFIMQTDINLIIDNVLVQFRQIIREKELELVLDLPSEPIVAYVDSEALTKIVTNLIANAVKFASSKIVISLQMSDNRSFLIRIENDGAIIPGAYRRTIFDPFVQVHQATSGQGTGLGLPLVRRMVELHEGSVVIDDSVAELNSLVVTIPLGEATMVENKEFLMDLSNRIGSSTEVAEILVVEDDQTLAGFIASMLSKIFTIHIASDGVQALEILDLGNIQLVITDVMMPRMDGMELSRRMKESLHYSHIPIIMLTAKSSTDSRIQGLECGVDAYLEKPFSPEHLVVQIYNLLENRAKLRESLARNPLVATTSLATTKADEEFLKQVTDLIHENIADELFSIDQLAASLCMSRSSLHRKIKGIAQMTPNDFIRLIRLKKAAEYLQMNRYRIGEISFIVGFRSPSYFTKCFQQQFGVLPKDFLRK